MTLRGHLHRSIPLVVFHANHRQARYPVLIRRRRIPCCFNSLTISSINGRSPSAARGFAVDATTDRRRVPKPPASKTALIVSSFRVNRVFLWPVVAEIHG